MDMKEKHEYDILILGGGPAGMTAAIYAARASLKVAILEENITGGLVNSTYIVENFPSYPSIHGMELTEKMREHVDSLDVTVEEVCEIEKVSLHGDTKIIETDEDIFTGRAIIIATGRTPLPLEVAEGCEQVHHCAICDGGAYKGKNVLVVGGGNSAFDESLYMLTLGVNHITLIESMDQFFAAQKTQDEFLSSEKVKTHTGTRVADITVVDDALKSAVLEDLASGDTRSIDIDGIFVFLGQQPNNEIFSDDISLTEKGYVIVDEHMNTNIPGVFSAGDINDKMYRQITTAMSDATIAALAAERYIRS